MKTCKTKTLGNKINCFKTKTEKTLPQAFLFSLFAESTQKASMGACLFFFSGPICLHICRHTLSHFLAYAEYVLAYCYSGRYYYNEHEHEHEHEHDNY